jgi:phosphopantothenoylcysteine decarboxylase/phosphopantothenate--cysteine ligase
LVANIVLGVTGSIACYRAADLARELMREGHAVRVCLTRSAAQFVTAALFEGLTGQPCLVDAFEEPERGRMAHIDWARWADLVLVAPATAHSLAGLARGEAVDMLTTIALASTAPLAVAPAMNPAMWGSDPTQEALAILRSRASAVIEPTSGEVACGENGQGKLASVAEIVAEVRALLAVRRLWEGKRVLITSGPTEEPWDDVRFLSNRSSGKMGSALARAALLMGAEAVVVAGPQAAPLPAQARIIRVRTALQMESEVLSLAFSCDLIIGAAAVADYRPAQPLSGKFRRSSEELSLALIPNPDIIAGAARAAKEGAVVIAFAAEPGDGLAFASAKAERKGVHAIAVNDVSRSDVGFGVDHNELNLVWRDGRIVPSGRRSKLECAMWLLEQAEGR